MEMYAPDVIDSGILIANAAVWTVDGQAEISSWQGVAIGLHLHHTPLENGPPYQTGRQWAESKNGTEHLDRDDLYYHQNVQEIWTWEGERGKSVHFRHRFSNNLPDTKAGLALYVWNQNLDLLLSCAS